MKLKLCIMFGGMSSEHSVSCMSAYNVLKYVNKDKYDISMIGIDLQGNFIKYVGNIENIKNNTWRKDTENLILIDKIMLEFKDYDAVFPVMHGRYSEDGCIQGLFELAKVKYVGCNVEGSSVGYNKLLSKILVKSIGVNIVNYTSFSKYETLTKEYIEEKINISNLSYPLFVKPNKEGSSYGVSKVNNLEEMFNAIKYALEFDSVVLIEEFIQDKKEVECSVLGNYNLIISQPGEIVINDDVYDFDNKYVNNTSSYLIPASIDKEKLNKIKEYSKNIFELLNLSGLARVDFFVTKDNIYFNEVNTMPGFTDISMYPKMLENIGISYSELIDRLIECSLNR